MFESPIKIKEFRKGVYAKMYFNGVINIEGIQYYFHSLTSAIKVHRQKYPKFKKS